MGNNATTQATRIPEDHRLIREVNRMNIRPENRALMMEIYRNNQDLSNLIQDLLVSMGYEREGVNKRRKTAGIVSFISLFLETLKLEKQDSEETSATLRRFSLSFQFKTVLETKIGVYVNRKRKTHSQTVKPEESFIKFEGIEVPAEGDLETFSLVIKASSASLEKKEEGGEKEPGKLKKEIQTMLFELNVTRGLQVVSFQRQVKLGKGVVVPLQEIYGWSFSGQDASIFKTNRFLAEMTLNIRLEMPIVCFRVRMFKWRFEEE